MEKLGAFGNFNLKPIDNPMFASAVKSNFLIVVEPPLILIGMVIPG